MAVMVGVHSHKKLPCLLGPVRYVEHGTSSTVGPEKHGIVAHRVKNVQRVTTICYDELSSYIERQIKYNPNLARRNHGTAARFLVIGFLIMDHGDHQTSTESSPHRRCPMQWMQPHHQQRVRPQQSKSTTMKNQTGGYSAAEW
jgi:hypothetical protein